MFRGSVDDAFARLTGRGSPYEVVVEPVQGVSMPVFKHRARSTRELLAESRERDVDYVVFEGRRLSFAQHFDAVAALAHVLRNGYGVQKGDRVAILAANCPEWILTFWASTSIGAVFASMNAWWAEPEIEHALTTCEPSVVVVDDERLPAVQAVAARVPFRILRIGDELDDALTQAVTDGELPDVDIDEDDPAVILYTSGTTGRSKGAVATHRSVCGNVSVNRFSAVASAVAAGLPEDIVMSPAARQIALVTVPLFHASGLYGFVVTQLAFGGMLVLRAGRFDEDDVLRLIETERVNMWAPLGSMGPRVADRAKTSRRDLTSLRTLGVGGAPVSPSVQAQLRAAFPNASLNVSMGYTSSEAVAVVTRIQGDDLRDRPTSAGRCVVTTEIEIRGEDGEPVPDGVDGEIHVRSPYLMAEYWRDPEATNAVLKPGRWLAMGDIGRLEDGWLHINSRARDLILVNAENVFPTEVEYRLDAHPDVVESAVFGVDDDLTGQAIRAAVVLRTGASVSADDLTSWCRAGLAGYKGPARTAVAPQRVRQDPQAGTGP
jgi:long-chain acyl-CoA synthetase